MTSEASRHSTRQRPPCSGQGVVDGLSGTVDLDGYAGGGIGPLDIEPALEGPDANGGRRRAAHHQGRLSRMVADRPGDEALHPDARRRRGHRLPERRGRGGRISHNGKNGPQVLPQASVDAICHPPDNGLEPRRSATRAAGDHPPPMGEGSPYGVAGNASAKGEPR